MSLGAAAAGGRPGRRASRTAAAGVTPGYARLRCDLFAVRVVGTAGSHNQARRLRVAVAVGSVWRPASLRPLPLPLPGLQKPDTPRKRLKMMQTGLQKAFLPPESVPSEATRGRRQKKRPFRDAFRYGLQRLFADCSDAREILAFEGLEHCATTGGNVADLVCITHLGNGCD